MASSGIEETADERRLRHAACLLGRHRLARASRLSRRAVDEHHRQRRLRRHRPSRPRLSRARGLFRHAGLSEEELSPRLRELATTRMLDRARVLGAAMRVAYMLTAGAERRAAEDADAGQRRPAGADAARQIARARRRAARPPDAGAGAADRARGGDRGVKSVTAHNRYRRICGDRACSPEPSASFQLLFARAACCNSRRNSSRFSWTEAMTRPVGNPNPINVASDNCRLASMVSGTASVTPIA